jgi:polyisoprenoid-binding protein YceI
MALWTIDTAHSEIKFKVKHLVVSTLSGHFKEFTATIESPDGDLSDAKIAFAANVNSIDTKNEQRDGHLRSADFFDAENYPKLTFVSKDIAKKTTSDYVVTGDLTIRGTTREVALDVNYNGTVNGFGGVEVSGFEITGKVNRQEYGLKWNALTEAGGVVVADEVKIEIFAEFNKAQ